MGLKIVTAPQTYPVSLDETKLYLRVDHDDDDSLIETLIKSANGTVDGPNGFLGRALIEQTWDLYLDEFPQSEIKIPLPPLIAVESVKYDASDGLEQTIDAQDYSVDTANEPGWIVPGAGGWPTPIEAINAVRIRFRAGYIRAESPQTENVPADIKTAILMTVGTLYAHRETVVVGQTATLLPWGAEQLLRPHRVYLGMA